MTSHIGNQIATRISVDLGGYHTRAFNETQGLILDEPSVGLIDMDHNIGGSSALGSFGHEALALALKSPSKRITPVLQADDRNPLGYSARMLRYHFSSLRAAGTLGKAPVMLLTIPPGITQSLTDELKHACFTAGASRVHLVDNAISTAVGANISIDSSTPQLILDLGARNARLYAIQLNEIVAAYSLPFGGDALDEQLASGIRERYGIYVTNAQAQQAKHMVGSARFSYLGDQLQQTWEMEGLQIAENQPVNFNLTNDVACELLQPAMRRASDALHAAVQALPYQFRDPQHDIPIVLTGGGALLQQIDQLVMEAGEHPVEVVPAPATVTVQGGASLLAQIHGEVTAEPV